MTKREATISAEYFLHQHIWHYAESLLQLRDDQAGPRDALESSACLLLAFSVEAHANRLLEAGFPKEYARERELSSSGQLKGTVGKLLFLAREWQVNIDPGHAPLQTVAKLVRWRDDMVHPRVERITRQASYVDPSQLAPPESDILAYPLQESARAFSDSEVVCDSLQAAAFARHIKGIYGPRAFKGPTSLRGVSL